MRFSIPSRSKEWRNERHKGRDSGRQDTIYRCARAFFGRKNLNTEDCHNGDETMDGLEAQLGEGGQLGYHNSAF